MAIEFRCPHCRGALKLKEKFAGQRGSCKHCLNEILVPSPAPPVEFDLSLVEESPQARLPSPPADVRPSPRPATRPTEPVEQQSPAAPPSAKPVKELIRFCCEHCGVNVKVKPRAAGRSVPCPRCAQMLRVPEIRQSARPMAAAAAAPQLDGLELLPEPDGLELLPEQTGLLDALDDTIAVAPAEAPLRPLPAPRPLPSKAKRKNAERQFWQLPAIQASGGVLTSLLVIAGIGLKIYYRVVTPIVNNSASSVAASMIDEAETVLSGIKRNVQMAQQMTDAASAQRLAGDWALQFIDAIDAGERLDRHAGTLIPLKDKKTYEDIAKSCEGQVAILNAHLVHLATIPNVQPILADALDKAIAARPTSKFAQTLRSQGIGSYGISGINRRQTEVQADQETRRAEAKAEEDARMAKMKADHDARAAQIQAESDARMAQMKADAERRTAEIQERMRAQSDSMRNLHPPGMRRGRRP